MLRRVSISFRVRALIPPRPPLPAGPSRAERVKYRYTHTKPTTHEWKFSYFLNYLHWCVFLQAVLDFHRQVGNVVSNISDQYVKLLGAGCKPLEDCSREQMKVQLIGTLNVSGRYFAFKEQMKVRTTTHIPGGLIELQGTLKPFFGFFPATMILLLLFAHSVCVFLVCSMQW